MDEKVKAISLRSKADIADQILAEMQQEIEEAKSGVLPESMIRAISPHRRGQLKYLELSLQLHRMSRTKDKELPQLFAEDGKGKNGAA